MSDTPSIPARARSARCSICIHPDGELVNRLLLLRKFSQAELARDLGVHPATVSRHLRNHVLPAIASGMVVDTAEVSLMNLHEELDRLYQIVFQSLIAAGAAGDISATTKLIAEARKLMEVAVKYAVQMREGNLDRQLGMSDEARWREYEAVRLSLEAKLDDLRERHIRGVRKQAETAGGAPLDGQADQSALDESGKEASGDKAG